MKIRERIPGADRRRLGFFVFGGRKRLVHTEETEGEQRVHGERKTDEREKRFGGVGW
jgi:hypothetical protein